MRDPRFRRARREDVPAIVRLLADDPLGAGREAPGEAELPAAYWRAFDAVEAGSRGQGVGRAMVLWAIEQARLRGCRLVQLTTDRRRPDALRFYESLGFRASHTGLKLPLD
ncbi:MAG TPA: GNAT family N-acetyltransferase [Actinomycetes bacterium]